MDNLKKLKMEKLQIAIEIDLAMKWGNKNRDIVKRELGNMYTSEEIRALWKDYTAEPVPTSPLWKKIHWKKSRELLRAHMEGLRDAGFISYDDIDNVMTGDEMPRTVKGIGGAASEDRVILYIFGIWWHGDLIDKAFYCNDGRDVYEWQYKDFIIKSFTRSNGKPFKSLQTAALRRGGLERKGDRFIFLDKDLHAALAKILK